MEFLALVTLVKEVDGFHTGIFFITDLQLVKLAKQIYQPLHDVHPILTETKEESISPCVAMLISVHLKSLNSKSIP